MQTDISSSSIDLTLGHGPRNHLCFSLLTSDWAHDPHLPAVDLALGGADGLLAHTGWMVLPAGPCPPARAGMLHTGNTHTLLTNGAGLATTDRLHGDLPQAEAFG